MYVITYTYALFSVCHYDIHVYTLSINIRLFQVRFLTVNENRFLIVNEIDLSL